MARDRSFTEYIADRFYDGLFRCVQNHVKDADVSELGLRSRSVQDFHEVELTEIEVKSVSVGDLPDMAIAFDVVVDAEFSVKEVARHYDIEDTCHQWFKLKCKGDLDNNLDDFIIEEIEIYDRKSAHAQPMSDSLVPILYKEQLDDVATDFLRRYYPEALSAPIPIVPGILAERMGLKIYVQEITAEGMTFGQMFFYDTETVKARSILVDPQTYFLRTLGSVHNTIIHECVHWDKHRKAFELQRLCDNTISRISCQVTGTIKEGKSEAVKWMEWQANALTPRIMMPRQMFIKKAFDVIKKHMANETEEFLDILEPVIDELAAYFGVSRLAAKIRMIEVGYSAAIGAFNYIDGRYVQPYAFEEGTLARNQTFSIGVVDAATLHFTDPEFAKTTAFGKYLYVDAHFVLNSDRYVEQDEFGVAFLTQYARLHMNECCLVFDISVKGDSVERSYSTECVLNRDINSPFEFEIKFHHGYENSTPEKQKAYLKSVMEENARMFRQLSNNHSDCLEQVRKWRKMTYTAIADEIPMEERQVRRIFQGESNGSIPSFVAICLVLHLPPEISFHIIEKSPLSFSLVNQDHQWYQFLLRYHYGKSIEEMRTFLQAYNVSL